MSNNDSRLYHLVEAAERLHRQLQPHLLGPLRLAEMVQNSPAIRFCSQHEGTWQALETLRATPWEAILKTQAQLHSTLAPYDHLIHNFQHQVDAWDRILGTYRMAGERSGQDFFRIRDASAAWNCGLADAVSHLDQLHLLAARADLTSRLLEPYAVFTEYSDRTLQRLDRVRSPRIASALTGSLTLAEVQVTATSEALAAVVEVSADDETLTQPKKLNLLDVQQRDLLTASELLEPSDPAALILHSPAAGASMRVRAIVGHIVQCNEAAKVVGRPEVFKPTTRLLEACNDLPWIVPVDKRTLGDFVDCLYFIFYEGAGKDHLRFLTTEGGVLSPGDCDFIWCIKHLRNKWSRHDADHGKEGDIRKSWSALADKFGFLGLKRYPIYPSDFRRLHEGLVTAGETFLSRLLDTIAGT